MLFFAFLYIVFTVITTVLLDKTDQAFSIYTEGCTIRNFPLVGENIKNLVNFPRGTINCSKSDQLLNSNQTHIWIDEEAFSYYSILQITEFYCCYNSFKADKLIENISYGKCIQILGVIKALHEFVRVECFYFDNKIYQDYFVFPKTRQYSTKDLTKFSVIMFGIESVSRVNFLRTMPETAKFLKERGSIQLLGYNKLGDNSFPNLYPLLTGHSFNYILKVCIHNNNTNHSNLCSFIWDKFKMSGFLTALGSDSPAGLLGSYEYSLRKLPTDYYLQPFMYETRNLFKNKHYNYHLCCQNKFYYKILLNYVLDLSKNIEKHNVFGIFWEESVSHEHLNYPHLMDFDYRELLQKIENNGYLNESVIVFFSDHGMRWGEIVETEQGRLEERLPLMEVLFPIKFKTLYKIAYQNFKENSGRLTTPYDIYYTLNDLLDPTLLNDEIIFQRNNKRRNRKKSSLFLPVSQKRTCEFVGISEHWCTCYKGKRLQAGRRSTIFAAQHLMTHINGLLNNYPQCNKLTIESILEVTVIKDIRGSTFRVVIRASPGRGVFDGTLRMERGLWAVSGTVSRLNLYRGQSYCVQDNKIEMYCYCKY